MIDSSTDLERRRFPWALARIDLWGMIGAVGALLIGTLLSMLWGPLFLLGLFAMVVAVLATRKAERTPPSDAAAIVSPVDGVLVSVSTGLPPAELRLSGGDFTRLRVASSPASTTSIHAPMSGEIFSLIEEAGDSSMRFASDPDEAGLANAYATFTSGEDAVAIRVVTGGLGPRLDITAETGDAVRVGRDIGYRRLGGWCDVWVPAGSALAVWPGMTLKGAETRLVQLGAQAEVGQGDLANVAAEAVPFEMPQLDEDAEDAPAAEGETVGDAKPEEAPVEAEPEEAPKTERHSEDDGVVKDATEQFARLRKKVESSKSDPD
ncbi:MAG: phosphatidylserine decarboxylase [Pseudomonadota bacterium]